ncbi:hypothetical protein BFW89_05595 [Pseudomonas synxantha]|nr:hypothetical protein [Pseudomonas sp. NCIMB 10586]MCK3843711.1 hypothetical protein [Pseudomonas sp. W15Feb34]MCK3862629.1 hypothetical protein [Pseudomonas sp. B329]OPB09114.1 hypothetical protein BFW89_05595 [Pseudomonas synxantha]
MRLGLAQFYVGAGLPAMQTPLSDRHTAVMLSQASQLPHWNCVAPGSIFPHSSCAHHTLSGVSP